MKTPRPLFALLAAVALAAGSARAADPVKPFVTMIPNNIFSAQQARPIRGGGDPRPTVPQVRIERFPAPLLTGVVIDDKDYVAFLEFGGKVTLARVGYKLPQPLGLALSAWPSKNQGTISEISLFSVTVNPADGSAPRRVDIGKNLADDTLVQSIVNVPSTAPAPDAAAAAPKTAAEAPATPGADPNDDPVTAAMKAKRAAALGGTTPTPTQP